MDVSDYLDDFQTSLLIPLLENRSFLLNRDKSNKIGKPRYAVTKRPFNMVNLLHLASKEEEQGLNEEQMYIGKSQAERSGGILKEGVKPSLLKVWKTREVDADGIEYELERPVATIVPVFNVRTDFEDGSLPEKMTSTPKRKEWDLEFSKNYILSQYTKFNQPDLSYLDDLPLDLQQKEVMDRMELLHIEKLIDSPVGSKAYVAEMMSVQFANYLTAEDLGVNQYLPTKEVFANGFINLIKNDMLTVIEAINKSDIHYQDVQDKAKGVIVSDNLDRVFLRVEWEDRAEVKSLGAKWDSKEKGWYFDGETSQEVKDSLQKWVSTEPKKTGVKKVDIPTYNAGLDMDVFVHQVLTDIQKVENKSDSLVVNTGRLENALSVGLSDNESYRAVAYKICKESYAEMGFATEKTYIAVDEKEKDRAKEMGASYDRKHKLWFVPVGLESENLLREFSKMSVEKIYLETTMQTKDFVKEHGAKWDPAEKSWYFLGSELPEALQAYIKQDNSDSIEEPFAKEAVSKKAERVYLDVPFSEKDTLKEDHGIKWDPAEKSWYYPSSDLPQSLDPYIKVQAHEEALNPSSEIPSYMNEVPAYEADPSFGSEMPSYMNEVPAYEADPSFGSEEASLNLNRDQDNTRIDLAVPFSRKDEASALGAKWDQGQKTWYYEGSELPSGLVEFKPDKAIKMGGKQDDQRIDLVVPFSRKDEASSLGARWDRNQKVWYYKGSELPSGLVEFKPENVERRQEPAKPAHEEFADYLKSYGFEINANDLLKSNTLRVPVSGDTGSKTSGFVVFHNDNPSGIPGGYATNNRTKEEIRWSSTTGLGRERTQEELDRIKELQRERDLNNQKEKERTQIQTTDLIIKELGYATAVEKSIEKPEYLNNKKVEGYSGVYGNKYGALLIPAKDINGEIKTLQYVNKDGSKIFKKGGQKKGAFHIVDEGNIKEESMKQVIFLTEGYATGASVYEAVDKKYPVVVAFDAGNLIDVGKALSSKYPDSTIVVAGDNDLGLERKGGVNIGKQATEELLGHSSKFIAVLPKMTKEEVDRGCSDWNDMVSKNDSQKEIGLARINESFREVLEKVNKDTLKQIEIRKSLEKEKKLVNVKEKSARRSF